MFGILVIHLGQQDGSTYFAILLKWASCSPKHCTSTSCLRFLHPLTPHCSIQEQWYRKSCIWSYLLMHPPNIFALSSKFWPLACDKVSHTTPKPKSLWLQITEWSKKQCFAPTPSSGHLHWKLSQWRQQSHRWFSCFIQRIWGIY